MLIPLLNETYELKKKKADLYFAVSVLRLDFET